VTDPIRTDPHQTGEKAPVEKPLRERIELALADYVEGVGAVEACADSVIDAVVAALRPREGHGVALGSLRRQVAHLEYRLADSQRNEQRANGRLQQMKAALAEAGKGDVPTTSIDLEAGASAIAGLAAGTVLEYPVWGVPGIDKVTIRRRDDAPRP
jgi:hypothetical protein